MSAVTGKRTSGGILKAYIAIPPEHGAWAFLIFPALIGGVLARRFTMSSALVLGALLAAFFLRQPVIMFVKVFSGRRPRTDLPAIWAWFGLYAAIGGLCAVGLLAAGSSFVLWLALPALPVLAWHLWLVSRRAEHRNPLAQVIGSGTLTLAAPALYWAGRGEYLPMGWLLWGLCWLQAIASILYTYLRLEQRRLPQIPEMPERVKMGWKVVLACVVVTAAVGGLAAAGVVSAFLPLAFAVQLAEAVWGTLRPVGHVRPAVIGFRQMAVSALFAIVFLLVW